MSTTVDTHRLERNAVGLAPTLFQSITHMAPAAAVAFSIVVGVPYAGGSIPLAVLLALIACLFVAISIGQLARHLPSAGGLYTFSSRGLHPYVGFLVAWGFMLAEPVVAPLLYLIFGNALAANLTSHFGWATWLWAPFAAGAGLIVWFLTYRGIRLSTRTGVALGTFEIVVFLALALTPRRCRRKQQHPFRLRPQHRQYKGLGIRVSGHDLCDPGLHRLRGLAAAG